MSKQLVTARESQDGIVDVGDGQMLLRRRRFLAAGFFTATGLASMGLVAAAARFLIGNALAPKPVQWAEIGELAQLPAGAMHKVVYQVRSKDAWRTTQRTGALYAFSADGEEFTVLDATCTHLGCNVHWRDETEQFRCPCHDGYFSRAGDVLGGPPPRPLTKLETKIENGVLYALV